MGHSSIYHENKLMTGICILGAIYLALSLHCYRRLLYLQKHSYELNTRKLFVMSCFLCCVLRVMSFTSIVVLNFGYINVDESLNSEDEDTFLGGAMLVLMDFPNYVIISAYMLLVVVWAEAFLQSRRHWMSDYDYRHKWLTGYLIFNTCLYSVQLCLYSVIFLPHVNLSLLTSLLYGAMTVINIFLPSTWFVLYVYMSIKFAGFPPASKSATDRLRALTKLGMVWTVSRLSWGAISLSEVTDKWLFDDRSSGVLLTIELLLVFFIVEIIPICMSLHISYLQALATSDFSPSVETRCEEAPSLYTNFHNSGTLYRDGYSFDGEDDLQKIIFTDSLDGRPSRGRSNSSSSSNESASPLSRGGSENSRKSAGTGTTGTGTDPGSLANSNSNRPSNGSGTSGSAGFGSARNTLASRGTTHTSSESLVGSDASEHEYAPTGEHTGGGWFSNWFH